MTRRARPGTGQNAAPPGDDALLGAALARSPSDEPVCRASENPIIAQFWNPVTAAGRAALDAVNRQAQIIAYIGDCNMVMLATLAVSLLTVFSKPLHERATDHIKPSHERGHGPRARGGIVTSREAWRSVSRVTSTLADRAAPSAASTRPALDEPKLDQLLAEPIVQQLMAS